MADVNELVLDIRSVSRLVDALSGGGERGTLLIQLKSEVESLRADENEYSELLDGLYDKVNELPHNIEALDQAVDFARRRDEAARETLHPRIATLKQKQDALRGAGDAEVHQLVTDSIAIAEACLSRTQAWHIKLLGLAAERRRDSTEVLRARPRVGEIDHSALSREFMARFQKIRGALAK